MKLKDNFSVIIGLIKLKMNQLLLVKLLDNALTGGDLIIQV